MASENHDPKHKPSSVKRKSAPFGKKIWKLLEKKHVIVASVLGFIATVGTAGYKFGTNKVTNLQEELNREKSLNERLITQTNRDDLVIRKINTDRIRMHRRLAQE